MQYKVLFMAFSNNSGVSFDNIYILMFSNKYVVMSDNFIQVGKSFYFFFIHIVDNSVNNSFAGRPVGSAVVVCRQELGLGSEERHELPRMIDGPY